MISLLDELYITALLRLKFESFEKLTGKKGKSDALYKFSKSKKDRNSETFKNGVKAVNTLAQWYEKFDDSIRKGNLEPITRFWQNYLDRLF